MQAYTEKLRLALTMIERYAESADRAVTHAMTQAEEAEGAALRLWLAQADQERARASAFRTAHETISAELGSEGA
jgi:hypothetical protein